MTANPFWRSINVVESFAARHNDNIITHLNSIQVRFSKCINLYRTFDCACVPLVKYEVSLANLKGIVSLNISDFAPISCLFLGF